MTENSQIVPASENMIEIDHIAIAVRDLDKAVKIYTEAFGFVEVERRSTQGKSTGMISSVLQTGKITVVLVQGVQPQSQVNRFISEFGEGVQHVAFRVGDIFQASDKAERADLPSDTGLLEDAGIRQTFLRRIPNVGVRIELIERNGGTFSDESVERLFRAMEAEGTF